MKPPSSVELPLLKSLTLKTSESVENILSYHHVPIRKVSFSFHKSISHEYFHTNKEDQIKFEEDKKSQSDKIFFNSVNPFDPAIIEYLSSFKDYLMAIKNKKSEIAEMACTKKVVVPYVKDDRKVLIFDIDDTLLFNLPSDDGEPEVILRPHCHEVLATLSEFYDIWLWTAAIKEHAEIIIKKYIDPGKGIIKNVFYRDQCISILENVFIKDLRIFSNVLPHKIAIIENQLISFATNVNNGFLIDSFLGNEYDDELFAVRDFFLQARNEQDITTALVKTFRFQESITSIIGA